eukprot:TRINITY_DN8867_c0_g1_i1.p1 TRINITY_DN8867_c0_g1~~TRINITY_DN8867_c0_g1_i1.p1  ORF type:complete len:958 (+),score=294.37 TRINITY_DN8867_c0_g1_i1:104-2875(+)
MAAAAAASPQEEDDELNITLGKDRANIEDLIRQGGATRKLREITAMVAWANTFLKPKGYEAKVLQQDFRDGVLMINLLESTFNKPVAKNYNLRPKLPVQKLDNYEWVFKFLNQEEIHTLSIDPHDIVNGKETQTLNLLWNILRKLTVTGLAGLSGHKEKSSATVREMLKQWVNDVLAKHPNLNLEIKDFWESFRDGLAFSAIVDTLAPGKLQFDQVASLSAPERLQAAFHTAEVELGIPSLLQVQELTESKDPDDKAVENYLCMLVSAQQAKVKKEVEVKNMASQFSEATKKKQEEISKLQEQIESEKKQLETVQDDLTKFKTLLTQTAESEAQLKDEIRAAQEDRSALQQKIIELTEELKRVRNQLLESIEREKEANQKNIELATELSVEQKLTEQLNEEIKKLNAELYRAHREHEDVVSAFKKKMREKQLGKRDTSSEGKLGDMVEQQIMENKNFQDFMQALDNREGFLLKQSKAVKKIGAVTLKKRYFVLKGDHLLWHKQKGGDVHGSVNLRWFKKIEIGKEAAPELLKRKSLFERTTSKLPLMSTPSAAPAHPAAELELSPNVKIIELLPDTSKKNNPVRKIRLTVPQGSLDDIYAWAKDINDRIALISYLEGMFDKAKETGRAQGCREIVNFISSSRETLLRIDNKVPSDFGNALIHFKESFQNRKDLELHFHNVAVTDSLVDLLSDIISHSNSFKSLALPRNLVFAKGGGRLADSLLLNASLQELDLSKNSIGDEGLTKIAQALPHHPKLRRLALKGNKISDVGVKELVKNLILSSQSNNQTHNFPAIELEENQVGDEGAEAIATLVEQNSSVSEVRLAENFISDAGAEALARVLGCKNLFVLSLASNQITTKGASALASAVQTLDRQLVVDLSFNKLIGRVGFSQFFTSEHPLEMELFKMVLNPALGEESKTGRAE